MNRGTKNTGPITIFRAGRHTAMSGVSLQFSEADLKSTVAAYDPTLHEAPLVVGHPRDNAPAYGWVGSLGITGTDLTATPRQVDPAFAESVNAGRFKKVSASFYVPDSSHNPTPGVYYLRHVGFLGAQPPAVKGLGDAHFGDNEEGVVTIEFGEPGLAFDMARVFRRLREFVIEKFSREDADRLVPEFMAEQLEITGARQIAESSKQFAEGSIEFAQTRLGRTLRRLMDENEITTKQLADAGGIAESTMASIIAGDIARPPDRRLRGFARALGVSFQTLRRLVADSEDSSEHGATIMQFAETNLVRYILQRMTQLQVTTADLAETDGLDTASVTNISSGVTSQPTDAQLRSLAGVLGTSADTLNSKVPGNTNFAERASDLDQRESAIKTKEADIVKRERETQRQEIVAFVEEQVGSGRLLPRHKDELLAVMESIETLDQLEFGEGDDVKKVTPLEWLKSFVASLPEQVDYVERAAPDGVESPTTTVDIAPGYTADADKVALHQKALVYAEQHDVDYVTAVLKLGG